jgi:A/G-specific adenine glycosylase
MGTAPGAASGRASLLAWWEPRRRAFPWREARDPYRILVSEVMLQQTQAPRVVPAYRAFLRRFPNVRALAAAPQAEVIVAWDGLGYNRRAIAISEAARTIVREHGGRVPADPQALQRLCGVGPYTAAAVASIAYDVPVPAVDTNVRRIVARALVGVDGHEVSSAQARRLAASWLDRDDPGAWNQALMDLGREVCRPKPLCDGCPLRQGCRSVASGRAPSRPPRRQGPFEGSSRQIRGAVVRAVRIRRIVSVADLVEDTGADPARVREAVERLAAEGLVEVRGGRVSLPA